jgi:hypothetical protein
MALTAHGPNGCNAQDPNGAMHHAVWPLRSAVGLFEPRAVWQSALSGASTRSAVAHPRAMFDELSEKLKQRSRACRRGVFETKEDLARHRSLPPKPT